MALQERHRGKPLQTLFFLLALPLTWASGALPAYAQQQKTVAVIPDQAWTDTGLTVTSGEKLSITATGSLDWQDNNCSWPDSDNCTSGPNGPGPTICDAAPNGQDRPAPSLPCNSLIGRIGADGTPFEVGTSLHLTATTAGELYLGVNDNYLPDNSGGWTAVITAAATVTSADTPVFSLKAGTYAAAQTVSISDATAGATIYYTTNGSTPTTSSTKYTAAIKVSTTETIKAIAVAKGDANSAVASATYAIEPPANTPTFSPKAGTYTTAQSVSISDSTATATIYYTTNGTTPTASSTKYTAQIKVGSTETLKAIAVAPGDSQSAVASATYTITPATYTIGGTVIGLKALGTVKLLNGMESDSVSGNGTFKLPTAVINGTKFDVTVGTAPTGQSCAVQNGSGTVANANITDVLVYCTYDVDAATLKATLTSVGLTLNDVADGVNYPYDYVSADTFNGVSAITSTFTINVDGIVMPDQKGSETYAVKSANAIPSYTDNSPGLGGIEGDSGDAIVAAEGMISGTQPQIYVAVLPKTSATTDSVNGKYTQVALYGHVGTGDIEADEGQTTLTNGSVSRTYTSNTAGTIVTGNTYSGTFTISNGLVAVGGGKEQGAVSADGDLAVVADTNSGDDPSIAVLLLQGTGVTQATFEGVYSLVGYGGDSVTATTGQAATLFAYGNGTYSLTYALNDNGVVTTKNYGTGTYTVASDGTLTLTASDGTVYHGAVSADGNAMVLAILTTGRIPFIGVGVRQ
jgi:hypothetical protein